MIRSHKASRRRDLIGIALCALVGVFALTKAPVSVADLVSDMPVSLNFSQLPITKVVELIRDFSGPAEIMGLEQLGDRTVTMRVQGVPAREALQRVLNCAGFAYEERGNTLAIVPFNGAVCASGTSID